MVDLRDSVSRGSTLTLLSLDSPPIRVADVGVVHETIKETKLELRKMWD